MNDWNKWLDYWMQKMKRLVPTNVEDSQKIVDKIKHLVLPPNVLLFSTNKKLVYINIDALHVIGVISWWLADLEKNQLLPPFFSAGGSKRCNDNDNAQ